MFGSITRAGGRTKAGLAVVVGILVTLVFLALDRSMALATTLGARPLLMALGLGLGAALAVLAVFANNGARKPTMATPVPILFRILAWWGAVALALMMVAFAAWRQWGILCFFASIAATVKTISVYTYIKRTYEFRIWEPFAVIIAAMLVVAGIFTFLGRANVPPPFEAALARYAADPAATDPASRPAPDLSAAGFELTFQGDVVVGGLPSTYYSYLLSESADRVDVYVAKTNFPLPRASVRAADPAGWWVNASHLYARSGNDPTHFVAIGGAQAAVDALVQAFASSPAPTGG